MLKRTFALATVIAPLFFAGSAWAHPQESRVAIELESPDHAQAGDLQVDFDLLDLQRKIVLKDTDLEIAQEKILHCFIYDPALKEFRHEHPTFDGSLWHVTTQLPVNGNYWIFLQGQLAVDHTQFTASERIRIDGGSPANPEEPVLGDVRTGTDEVSTVTLSPGAITAGQASMLMLSFSRTDGATPVITPYLGALAHVTIVPADGDSLIHVHPMAAPGNQLMIHTEFPEAGDYRMWVQFVDGGVLRTVALSVSVQ